MAIHDGIHDGHGGEKSGRQSMLPMSMGHSRLQAPGVVAERLKAAVLKTAKGESPS